MGRRTFFSLESNLSQAFPPQFMSCQLTGLAPVTKASPTSEIIMTLTLSVPKSEAESIYVFALPVI